MGQKSVKSRIYSDNPRQVRIEIHSSEFSKHANAEIPVYSVAAIVDDNICEEHGEQMAIAEVMRKALQEYYNKWQHTPYPKENIELSLPSGEMLLTVEIAGESERSYVAISSDKQYTECPFYTSGAVNWVRPEMFTTEFLALSVAYIHAFPYGK